MVIAQQPDSQPRNARNALTVQQQALIELVDAGLKLALLREPAAWDEAGDIDIVVCDMAEMDGPLIELGYLRLSSHATNRKYVRYDWATEQWIHLDVQSTVRWGRTEAPPEFITALLARARFSDAGIPRLDPADEAILLILHLAVDKGALSPNYRQRVFGCDRALMQARAACYAFLPSPLGEYLDAIEGFRNGKTTELAALNRIRASFSLSDSMRPPFWGRLVRRLAILARGNPAIAFLGPDGAGKSTLTEPLARLRWPPVRRQFMGPARESEMRRTFHWAMRTLDRTRQRYSKKHPLGIVSRAAWQLVCYLDFWDRLVRHGPFCRKRGVLVCDRYACDMYFRKPTRWNEFLFLRLFPRPRFVFLCVGDPQAIHHRKPELPPDQIQRTIERYRAQLARYGIPFNEIDTTTLTPDKALCRVVQHLIDNAWFRAGKSIQARGTDSMAGPGR